MRLLSKVFVLFLSVFFVLEPANRQECASDALAPQSVFLKISHLYDYYISFVQQHIDAKHPIDISQLKSLMAAIDPQADDEIENSLPAYEYEHFKTGFISPEELLDISFVLNDRFFIPFLGRIVTVHAKGRINQNVLWAIYHGRIVEVFPTAKIILPNNTVHQIKTFKVAYEGRHPPEMAFAYPYNQLIIMQDLDYYPFSLSNTISRLVLSSNLGIQYTDPFQSTYQPLATASFPLRNSADSAGINLIKKHCERMLVLEELSHSVNIILALYKHGIPFSLKSYLATSPTVIANHMKFALRPDGTFYSKGELGDEIAEEFCAQCIVLRHSGLSWLGFLYVEELVGVDSPRHSIAASKIIAAMKELLGDSSMTDVISTSAVELLAKLRIVYNSEINEDALPLYNVKVTGKEMLIDLTQKQASMADSLPAILPSVHAVSGGAILDYLGEVADLLESSL